MLKPGIGWRVWADAERGWLKPGVGGFWPVGEGQCPLREGDVLCPESSGGVQRAFVCLFAERTVSHSVAVHRVQFEPH